jgi:hypothetical protein
MQQKATVFQQIIKDGGFQNNWKTFQSETKNFAPVVQKLCCFATFDIFIFAAEFGGLEKTSQETIDSLKVPLRMFARKCSFIKFETVKHGFKTATDD